MEWNENDKELEREREIEREGVGPYFFFLQSAGITSARPFFHLGVWREEGEPIPHDEESPHPAGTSLLF